MWFVVSIRLGISEILAVLLGTGHVGCMGIYEDWGWGFMGMKGGL